MVLILILDLENRGISHNDRITKITIRGEEVM